MNEVISPVSLAVESDANESRTENGGHEGTLDDADTSRIASAGADRSADVLEQYGLSDVLTRLRARKLRTTFAHYLSDIPTNIVPIRPRCKAGSLMEIALQPVNEDERKLEEFDERVLHAALTLREGGPKPSFPAWLDEEQPLGDDDRKKRREKRKKKKKKRSSKRKREGDTDGTAGDHEDGLDDDEKALRKKRKKRKGNEDSSQDPTSSYQTSDYM